MSRRQDGQSPDSPPAQNRSMIRGALASLSVRLLDLPSRYGFHLLVAVALGVVDTGRFYIVYSMTVALAGFGRLGLDMALTRQIAMDMASDRPAAVRPVIRRGLILVLVASTCVSVLLAAGASLFAVHVLKKSELAVPLALGALTLIPQNLGAALAGALAGLQRVSRSQMIYSWLWPAIFCVAAIPLSLAHLLTVNNTLILTAASFAVAALVGAVLLQRALPEARAEQPATGVPALLKPGLSFFSLEVTKLLLTSAPAIVLGIVATDRDAGLFALTWRMALAINMLISGVAGMAVPRFAELYTRGNAQALEKNAAQAIGLVVCLALPAAALLLIFPTHLLALFGHGYDQGAATLRLLTIGQFVAACFTAMPEMLGMTSHMNALYRINIATLAVLLVGLAGLAPLYGSAGAALATLLALAVNGTASAWMARRLLGVAPHAWLWREALGHLRRRNPRGDGTAS
ncbi:lipopolysaccharide biosynthesis protein [Bordetella sp. FB-8]|uniref:lipopolysaccharide biosynthesis protein n=1 Tax=Bordetella sp. FB-8 TaxID=1159870 RepID=UPI0012DE3C22|nr:lipopolysaccharide biosynthesis protein [Bordetella sp. FB-8]